MELIHCTSRLLYPPQNTQFFLNLNTTFHNQMTNRYKIFGRKLGSALVVKARERGAEAETAVIEKPKLRRFQVSQGYPMPFGATPRDGGVNFAIFSANSVSATICLISLKDLDEQNRVTEHISLDPLTNKTGDVWHVLLKGDFKDMLYGYKFDGSFSSRTEFPGTYLGVVEKLDHLKELGINCIELMPCHEFNELEYFSYNSVLGDYKYSVSTFYLEISLGSMQDLIT